MSDNEAKIVNPELPINKKLGNIKFEQAFDAATVNNAERAVVKNEQVFKVETANDYSRLKSLFTDLDPAALDQATYKQISEMAFSIKARAATGGLPLASQIANSMYKFADAASGLVPEKAYMVLKLHFDALVQVFDFKFAADSKETSDKLIHGLEEVAQKFLSRNE